MPLRLSPRAAHARRFYTLAAALLLTHLTPGPAPPVNAQQSPPAARPAAGSLRALDREGRERGLCPLKHTDVRAEVSGFLARVTVTQQFENRFREKIEAVYTFPLPQAAAVDDLTLKVGDRTVRGKILRREEAQAVYESARAAGQVAALLDQLRPNVFTQSVANVAPGESVTVTISYVETLKYEDGAYEFVFPTVVGERYVPRGASAARVPDAARLNPPAAPAGTRAGHDVSIEVALDAGVPVEALSSPTHEIEVERAGPSSARVRLKRLKDIPNRDFVLRYDVSGRRVEDAVLAHRDARGGYFTLILQPPDRVSSEDVTPKELVFVLDTSGSMQGFPLEKAKEAMGLALDGLNPQDTFNLITFSGDTHVLFPEPVQATPENLSAARDFLRSREGGGGTEMLKAISAALDPSDSQAHVRIVCFMTDGYVANEAEIIAEIARHPNARVFAFGIGSAVNRYLLDKMAEHGRGEVEYVTPNDDGSAAARRFHERVRSPLLTDVEVDWGGLPVADVYPRRAPDLFSSKPLVLSGRYLSAARGKIRLRGRAGGYAVEREIDVELPESRPEHEVLASLWARRRVDALMAEGYARERRGEPRADVREAVTQLGLEYRLMTQFTSFVAVEEVMVVEGGQARRVEVPVEVPAGVAGSDADGELHPIHFLANSVGITSRSGGNSHTGPHQPPTAALSAQVQQTTSAQVSAKTVNSLTVDVGDDDAVRVTSDLPPELRKELAKLHPSLAVLVARLRKKEAGPGPAEAKFVKGGKAELRVWLKEKSPAVLRSLEALGFEVVIEPRTANLVIGRIDVDKLEALAALDAVRYVTPQ